MTITLDPPEALHPPGDPFADVPVIVDDATRRQFLFLIGAAGMVAACDDGRDDGDDGAPSSETRRIEHALGATDVPVSPARVAALNVIAADPVLSLGVPAIAVPDLLPPVLEPLADGLDRLGSEVNLEQLAELGPDLILSASFEGALFEQVPIEDLQRIAPTVAYEFTSDYEWRDYYRFYADVLGRRPEADDRLGDLDERIAAVAAALREPAATTVSVVRVNDDGSLRYFRTGRSFAGSVLDPIGFAAPDVPADLDDLSLENLELVDADVLFVFAGEPETAPEVTELEAEPLYQQLRAVQAGRSFVVGPHWFGFGVLAAEEILNDVEEALR